MINFNDISKIVINNFKGGEGYITAQMFVDENGRIMKAHLEKGSSIGIHTHDTSSEVIYVIEGTATCIIDEKVEIVNEGSCHYCPKGSTHTIKNERDKMLVVFCVVPNQ